MLRTHTCGDLRKSNVGKEVTLCGWVHSSRDHGGVIFIDLRDRYGLTQIVFDPKVSKEMHKEGEKLRREDCIQVTGKVNNRAKGMANPKLKTGDIEVFIKKLNILNKSETPPMEIDDLKIPGDDVRLRWRYLDLRRPQMQHNLIMRSKAAVAAREYLTGLNFVEIETPMLMKSTPEGARDYVVPSRVNPGKFYALPQSPQIYKQLLMVSGMDRYFQLARCLRDEDLRMDRQPEHTQIDVEMSFVEVDDLLKTWEGLFKHIYDKAAGIKLKIPFPRLTYADAMDKYGTDKPDIRFDLFLTEVSDIVKDSDFGVFKDVVAKGGMVKVVNPKHDFSRNELDAYIKFCQQAGAKGMAWMRVTKDGLESNIVKYFSNDIQKKLIKKIGAKPGSTLMFIADSKTTTNDVLARLRNKLGSDLNLFNPKEFAWCFVTDFPLFGWNTEEDKWEPAHHMFCQPLEEDMKLLDKDPGKVKCTQYDVILNGIEMGSGSIRITDPVIQEKVFGVIGLNKKEVQDKFGFLLESFKFGPPPHGGIGIGFDRVVALMLGFNDIREVIAFPKNKNAQNPMDGSPSDISDKQLKELHIKKDLPKK